LKHLLIVATTVATFCTMTPTLAQVTNEGLLENAMGREEQRFRDQHDEQPGTDESQRERALERCLVIAEGGSPLPPECRALVANSDRRPALHWPWSHRSAPQQATARETLPQAPAEAVAATPPPAQSAAAPASTVAARAATGAAAKAQCGMVPVPGGVKLVRC
jgi:hypothetical protein